MNWFKKLSWLLGREVPPDLDDDLPAYELLNMATDGPISIANTDEVSVILEPSGIGNSAKLVTLRQGSEEPLSEHLVLLNTPLSKLRHDASAMARKATAMLSMQSQDFQFE